VQFAAPKKATTPGKKRHAPQGTIRDERGYTEREEVRQRTTHSDFMDSNVRKKLFPSAF
jgi:hypothetical protein